MKKTLSAMVLAVMIFTAIPGVASATCDLCGDLTGDGLINIADVVAFADWYIPIWDPPVIPECPYAADLNCDGAVRLNCYEPNYECDDLQYLLDYIFRGGPAPCDPDDDGIPDCDPY